MAKHHGKKVPITCCEKCLMATCCIIALILLILCIPMLTWRKSLPDPAFMFRFPLPRYWSLFSVTTNTGVWMSWLAMRTSMCAQMQIFQAPNLLNQIIGAAASFPLIPGVGAIGGAAMGCQYWQNCKNDCSLRCNYYGTLAYTGLTCIALNMLGIIACFAVPAFLAVERDNLAKKKKKLIKAAKFNTMVGCCFAGFIPIISVLMWFASSSAVLSTLQNDGYYPYAGASMGLQMGFFSAFLGGLVIIIGVNRHLELIGYSKPSKKHDDDEDEQEEGADVYGAPPGAMPGQMPGYGAPAMGYPGAPPAMMPGAPPAMMPGQH